MALDHIVPLTLDFPTHLSPADRARLTVLAERNLADHGDDFLGLVLSGSAGRGMATDISDLDAFVVLSDDAAAGRTTAHAPDVDEIPWSRSELDTVGAFGTEEWWSRWSCAWAPVLLDRTGGWVTESLRRQATLSPEEADALLIEHDRLDGWVNFAYRALKSDRDGRTLESRLDACESLPWLLDVVFAIAGRVRPYNKYLPWELRTHPVDGWPADELLGLVERTLGGDVDAIRETFPLVRAACTAHDARRGHTRAADMIDGWGDDLDLFAQGDRQETPQRTTSR